MLALNEYKCFPPNMVLTDEDVKVLQDLERLWWDLHMILFRANLCPALITKEGIQNQIIIGQQLGLINGAEAGWILQNIYWITPIYKKEDNGNLWPHSEAAD